MFSKSSTLVGLIKPSRARVFPEPPSRSWTLQMVGPSQHGTLGGFFDRDGFSETWVSETMKGSGAGLRVSIENETGSPNFVEAA